MQVYRSNTLFLLFDEGGDYGNDNAFTNIISQCRKYKAGLIFCNQRLDQLSPEVLGAMMSCAIKCLSALENPTETKKMAASLRVEEDFIRNLKKKDRESAKWALYVRGQNTMGVTVPFGILEAKEKRADYDRFIQENRTKYCVVPSPRREEGKAGVLEPAERPRAASTGDGQLVVFRHGKRLLIPHNAPDESYFD